MNYGNSSVSIGGSSYFVGSSSTIYSPTYTYSASSASVFYTVSYYPSQDPKILPSKKLPSCEAEIEGLISFEED